MRVSVVVFLLASSTAWSQAVEDDWQRAHYAGTSAYSDGRYGDAEQAWLRALGIARAIDPGDYRVGRTLKSLASVYRRTDRPEDAEEAYQQALVVYEENGECQSPECLDTLKQLASLHEEQGRYEEAQSLLERELQGREESNSPRRVTAVALKNLGRNASERGDYVAAEAHYRRALEILAQRDAPEDEQLIAASIRLDLAKLQIERGDLGNAETLLREEIAVLDTGHSPAHEAFLGEAMALYADVLNRTGRKDEAAVFVTRSKAMKEKVRWDRGS